METSFNFHLRGKSKWILKKLKQRLRTKYKNLVKPQLITDICTVAKLIAVKDSNVQEKLVHKLVEGNLYRDTNCSKRPSIPELVSVIFHFDCAEGVFCLVPPTFAAVVNMITREVKVSDPYFGEMVECQHSKCGCSGNGSSTERTAMKSGSSGLALAVAKHT